MGNRAEFIECELCATKPGSCHACVTNRATIARLEKEVQGLSEKRDSPSVCSDEECQYESWAYCPHCGEAT